MVVLGLAGDGHRTDIKQKRFATAVSFYLACSFDIDTETCRVRKSSAWCGMQSISKKLLLLLWLLVVGCWLLVVGCWLLVVVVVVFWRFATNSAQ